MWCVGFLIKCNKRKKRKAGLRHGDDSGKSDLKPPHFALLESKSDDTFVFCPNCQLAVSHVVCLYGNYYNLITYDFNTFNDQNVTSE